MSGQASLGIDIGSTNVKICLVRAGSAECPKSARTTETWQEPSSASSTSAASRPHPCRRHRQEGAGTSRSRASSHQSPSKKPCSGSA